MRVFFSKILRPIRCKLKFQRAFLFPGGGGFMTDVGVGQVVQRWQG